MKVKIVKYIRRALTLVSNSSSSSKATSAKSDNGSSVDELVSQVSSACTSSICALCQQHKPAALQFCKCCGKQICAINRSRPSSSNDTTKRTTVAPKRHRLSSQQTRKTKSQKQVVTLTRRNIEKLNQYFHSTLLSAVDGVKPLESEPLALTKRILTIEDFNYKAQNTNMGNYNSYDAPIKMSTKRARSISDEEQENNRVYKLRKSTAFSNIKSYYVISKNKCVKRIKTSENTNLKKSKVVKKTRKHELTRKRSCLTFIVDCASTPKKILPKTSTPKRLQVQ